MLQVLVYKCSTKALNVCKEAQGREVMSTKFLEKCLKVLDTL